MFLHFIFLEIFGVVTGLMDEPPLIGNINANTTGEIAKNAF